MHEQMTVLTVVVKPCTTFTRNSLSEQFNRDDEDDGQGADDENDDNDNDKSDDADH